MVGRGVIVADRTTGRRTILGRRGLGGWRRRTQARVELRLEGRDGVRTAIAYRGPTNGLALMRQTVCHGRYRRGQRSEER